MKEIFSVRGFMKALCRSILSGFIASSQVFASPSPTYFEQGKYVETAMSIHESNLSSILEGLKTGINGEQVVRQLKIYFPTVADRKFLDSFKQAPQMKFISDDVKRDGTKISFHLQNDSAVIFNYTGGEKRGISLNGRSLELKPSTSAQDFIASVDRVLKAGGTAQFIPDFIFGEHAAAITGVEISLILALIGVSAISANKMAEDYAQKTAVGLLKNIADVCEQELNHKERSFYDSQTYRDLKNLVQSKALDLLPYNPKRYAKSVNCLDPKMQAATHTVDLNSTAFKRDVCSQSDRITACVNAFKQVQVTSPNAGSPVAKPDPNPNSAIREN
jgi:hypothetical protein